jgi:hypothetical protein
MTVNVFKHGISMTTIYGSRYHWRKKNVKHISQHFHVNNNMQVHSFKQKIWQ